MFEIYINEQENYRSTDDICRVYGASLISFSISRESNPWLYAKYKDEVLRTAEVCPNAKLHVPLPYATSAEELDFITSLGRGVLCICVWDSLNVGGVAAACPTLHNVEIRTHLQDLGRLESTLSALLTPQNVFHVEVGAEGSPAELCTGATSIILKIVAKGAPELKSLVHYGPLEDIDAWRRFATACCALKDVYMRDARANLCCEANPNGSDDSPPVEALGSAGDSAVSLPELDGN